LRALGGHQRDLAGLRRGQLAHDPGPIDLDLHDQPLAVEREAALRARPAAHQRGRGQLVTGLEAQQLKLGIHGPPGKCRLSRPDDALGHRLFLQCAA
jgi:hypothetical protein